MDMEQLFLQLFNVEFKQNGLDGKLAKEEIMALMGVCHQEMSKELEIASRFLSQSPGKTAILDFYSAERAKEAAEIMAVVDTSRTHIDIGKLSNIPFTPAMWEAVKGCRIGAHFAKLDVLSNYYTSRWGNPIDGNHSIDAAVNKSLGQKSGSGCTALLLSAIVFLFYVLTFR